MLKLRKNTSLPLGAAFTAGVLMSSGSANAAGGNDFSSIATNIQISVSSLPGLLTALA